MSEELLTISWSALREWEHCRQKAYLRRQRVKNPNANIRQFFHGTVSDRIVRNWLHDVNRQPGQLAEAVEEYIELCAQEARDSGTGKVRWKNDGDKDYVTRWCKELLGRAEEILYELVIPHEPYIFADRRLKTRLMIPGLDGTPREVELLGILDILIDSPEHLQVFDLKATEDENYWKKTIMQLVFYHLILKHGEHDRVPDMTALIQPMCRERVKPIDIDQSHELALMSKIVAYAHSYWEQDFSPKESDAGCLTYCEVKHACAKFKKQEDGKLSWT